MDHNHAVDECAANATECHRCREVVCCPPAHVCHPVGRDRWLLAHIDAAIARWGIPQPLITDAELDAFLHEIHGED